MEKRFLQSLRCQKTDRAPFWFMRQAGRYLPEYREVRAGCDGFLDLCFTPEKAAEVTLQPIRRFDMDAAILFSDILVIPHALGQQVRFVQGEGPKLDALKTPEDIARLTYDATKLAPVMQTLRLLTEELPKDKALIGFSGSPWTLACYMLEGSGSKDFAIARRFGQSQPEAFAALLKVLEQSIIAYVTEQVKNGAEAIQLFDSWAGVCNANEFDEWVIAPTKRIVAALKAEFPQLSIIGFPRLAGIGYRRYAKETGVDAVSIDGQITPEWAIENLCDTVAVQGNLDNLLLATNGEAALDQARYLLDAYRGQPYIFNLSHGFLPETPVKNVERLVELLKQG
jgi:uroporphyrinogen decarboxylase